MERNNPIDAAILKKCCETESDRCWIIKYFIKIDDSEALSVYFEEIQSKVIGPLRPKGTQRRISQGNE